MGKRISDTEGLIRFTLTQAGKRLTKKQLGELQEQNPDLQDLIHVISAITRANMAQIEQIKKILGINNKGTGTSNKIPFIDQEKIFRQMVSERMRGPSQMTLKEFNNIVERAVILAARERSQVLRPDYEAVLRLLNVSKATLHRRCQEFGISIGEGASPESLDSYSRVLIHIAENALDDGKTLEDIKKEAQKRFIEEVLRASKGKRGKAATKLGISMATLGRIIKQLNIDVENL